MKTSELKAALAAGVTEFARKPRKHAYGIVLVAVESFDGKRAVVREGRRASETVTPDRLVLREQAEAFFACRQRDMDSRDALRKEALDLAASVEGAIAIDDLNEDPLDGTTYLRLSLTELRVLVRVMAKAGLGPAMGLTKSEAQRLASEAP